MSATKSTLATLFGVLLLLVFVLFMLDVNIWIILGFAVLTTAVNLTWFRRARPAGTGGR